MRLLRRLSRLDSTYAELLVILLVIIGFGLWFFFGQKAPPPRDDAGCLLPLQAQTVLLLDKSDPLSPRQSVGAADEFNRVVNNLALNERLDVYVIEGVLPNSNGTGHVARTVPVPVARLCQIARTREQHAGSNISWREQEQIIAQFERKLSSLRSELFGETNQPPRAADSPIFEYIQQISLDMRRRGAAEKRLIIISDFGQYTPGRFNICDPPPSFSAFSKGHYYREVRPDLDGVVITAHYLQRRGGVRMDCNAKVQADEAAHKAFWRAFFEASGAAASEPLFFTLLQ